MDRQPRSAALPGLHVKPSIQVVDLDGESQPMSNSLEDADDGSEEQWESASLYEDAIEAMAGNKPLIAGPDVCSPEEAATLQQLYRTVGEERFFEQTLDAGRYSARKLCTAFEFYPPELFDGAPDKAFIPFLELAISRWSEKRQKLDRYNTVDDAVALLKRSQNIIVLTGAGISTSLGIPDFRSKETGLYARLEHLGLDDPQQVFDIEIFREDPSIFYSIAKDVFPASTEFSPTHAFIRLLQDKEKLLTNYTQNIDDLESHAGIENDKLVQCHGSFATATCQKCHVQVRVRDILTELRAGKVARCRVCQKRIERLGALGMKRKRSKTNFHSSSKKRRKEWEDDSDDQDTYEVEEAGVMKPDITFFGEALPSTFKDRLLDHDRHKVDLVIVVGTSLKVAPVAKVPFIVPPNVPQIFISRASCKHTTFDIELLGECDTVVAELCERAGWDLDHEMVRKDARASVVPVFGQKASWIIQHEDSARRAPFPTPEPGREPACAPVIVPKPVAKPG